MCVVAGGAFASGSVSKELKWFRADPSEPLQKFPCCNIIPSGISEMEPVKQVIALCGQSSQECSQKPKDAFWVLMSYQMKQEGATLETESSHETPDQQTFWTLTSKPPELHTVILCSLQTTQSVLPFTAALLA